MALYQYANNPQTTLSGAITAGATSISVASSTRFPPRGDFTIIVDSEIMLVTGVTGTTWTVTRGAESTAAASHNNNAVVTNVLTKGSLLNAHHFDVRAYGAAGDGVADDTSAIQSAINAAGAGEVFFPNGTYRITSQLNVTTPGIHLRGTGYGSFITATASGVSLLVMDGADRAIVSDLRLAAATTAHVIRMGNTTGCNDVVLRGLILEGGERGITASNGSARGRITGCHLSGYAVDGIHIADSTSSGWQIHNNTLVDGCINVPTPGVTIGAAIMLSTSNDHLVSDNLVQDNGIGSPAGGAGIYMNNSSHNIIRGNRCKRNGKTGSDFNGQGILAAGASSINNVISGNICDGNAAEGITSYSGARDNIIVGNQCRGNGMNQIEVFDADATNIVSGNIADGEGGGINGIYIGSSAGLGTRRSVVQGNIAKNNQHNGIRVSESFNVTVTGNMAVDNGRSGSLNDWESSGFLFEGDSPGCIAVGNVALDSRLAGSKTQRYGLTINNTATVTDASNRLVENATTNLNGVYS